MTANRVEVRYFAWIRERLGLGSEVIEIPATIHTVAALVAWMSGRGATFESIFGDVANVRAAVDQQLALPDTDIRGAREIAFFPPMTGG